MKSSYKYYSIDTVLPNIEKNKDFSRVVFDICGTLFIENTTIALLNQIASYGGIQSIQIVFWHIVAFLGKRLNLISPVEYMHIRIKGLCGVSKDVIANESKTLVYQYLHRRENAIDILTEVKRKEIEFGYATFTLKSIAQAVKDEYGGDILCARELDYNNLNICTGRYKTALNNCNKEKCLPENWKKNLDCICFITDDLVADKSMLQSVGYPVYMPLFKKQTKSKLKYLLYSFPGVYYYSTRYDNLYKPFAHILKFWGSYLLTIQLTIPGQINFYYLLPSFIAYLAIYDIGCFQNDTKASFEDKGTTRNKVSYYDNSLAFFTSSFLWALLCLLIVFIMNIHVGLIVTSMFILLYTIFWLHNSLEPRQRILTFYLLYLIKGLVVLTAVVASLNIIPVMYLIFCILFPLTYLPKYIHSKYKHSINKNINHFKKIILQPIIWKNIILVVLSMLNTHFLFVLIWMDLITLVEFLIGRCYANKGFNNG